MDPELTIQAFRKSVAPSGARELLENVRVLSKHWRLRAFCFVAYNRMVEELRLPKTSLLTLIQTALENMAQDLNVQVDDIPKWIVESVPDSPQAA